MDLPLQGLLGIGLIYAVDSVINVTLRHYGVWLRVGAARKSAIVENRPTIA
jgi:hypothetical protein